MRISTPRQLRCIVTAYAAVLCIELGGSHPQANAQYLRKDCGSDVSVTEAEVFSGMIPPSPNLPESCRSATAQISQRFAQEDRNNWEALSNRACSAKLGWVENSPGICSAGGPPPICKRTDHWHKDSAKAESEWNKFKHDQYAEPRQKQIADAGCGCWLDAVSSQTQDRKPSTTFNPYSPTKSEYNGFAEQAIVPCTTTAECQVSLPGSVCSAKKSCEIPSAIERQVTSTVAFADGRIIDHAKDGMLDIAGTQMLSLLPVRIAALATEVGEKFLFRTGSGVVFGLFEAQETDSLLPSYRDSLAKMHDNVTLLQSQYLQLKRMSENRGPREPYSRPELITEIQHTKAELRMNMDNANGFLAGVVREQQMHPGACYNVLQFQNSSLMAYGAAILSLPE